MAEQADDTVLGGSLLVRENRVAAWSLPIHIYPYADAKHGAQFVSECLALRLTSHGKTREEAQRSMEAMIAAFLEEVLAMGTLDDVLRDRGWNASPREGETSWRPPPIISTLASATVIG